MAVMSVRMNKEEEQVINYLASYFEEEKSRIIKRSLMEMYEDILDKNEIKKFEENENIYTFVSADKLLQSLE